MNEVIIKKHPGEKYGIFWISVKWSFIIVALITILIDLSIESFFHQNIIIRGGRIFLLALSIFLFIWLITWEYSSIKSDNELDEKDKPCKKIEWEYDRYNVWDNYKHADNLYHQRFNFFILAESMFVVSFATALTSTSIDTSPIRIAIIILGMVFTLSWFYTNKRLDWRLVFLSSNYLEKNEEYNKYIACTRKFAPFYTGLFLSNILPGTTFTFWYFLFYITRWSLL